MLGVERDHLLAAIRLAVERGGGNRISRQQFLIASGLKLGDIFQHFPRWSDALTAAGFRFDPYNAKIEPNNLLTDWAMLTRKLKRIPTRNEYKLQGRYSATVFERSFGPWSALPEVFRAFAADGDQWRDVFQLLPIQNASRADSRERALEPAGAPKSRIPRKNDRPTYGDPIDFRGLRHAPVNEDGVIFLFGIVARELGFLVESVQGGFPDCEAKRQIAPGQWQRVRIEFEFESRNFRDHGHPFSGCDVIVCWHHNWQECPAEIEVVELDSALRELAAGDE